ncbi:MAG: hypothetical protein ABI556_13085 [Gemmatimonadales bacterium]
MIRRWSRALVGAICLALAACSSGATKGTEPPVDDSKSVENQIRGLFQSGPERESALAQAATIRQQLSAGATAAARTGALTLVDFTLKAMRAGTLIGGNSAAGSVSLLVDAIYKLVDYPPPALPLGALGNDGAAEVVGPAGATVVTPSGAAGVVLPSGAVSEPVLITISRLPTTPTPGSGPLPTALQQYPPFYLYSAYPPVLQFGDSARVGICQVTDLSSPFYPPEPHERLRLAHAVGNTVEILDRVSVDDFLKCIGVSPLLGQRNSFWNKLSGYVSVAFSPFGASDLYAAHGGLGGKTKSFSPFGAVDPGPPVFSNTRSLSPRITFLFQDANDPGEPPVIVNLVPFLVRPGDQLKLELLGEIKYGPAMQDDGLGALIAVFSSTSEILPQSARARVPGAISAGLSVLSNPTFNGNADTDIPEDFLVTRSMVVKIPPGARYLFLGVRDVFINDNTDPNGNFGVRISSVPPQ